MIYRRTRDGWDGVPVEHYKDEPGTWMRVTRRVLFGSGESAFEGRYFEIEPGGYTSLERHRHEHFVTVLVGQGTVTLDGEEHEVSMGDVVHVTPGTPHCFGNPSSAPFGIVCVVDRERDRPELLDPQTAFERPTV